MEGKSHNKQKPLLQAMQLDLKLLQSLHVALYLSQLHNSLSLSLTPPNSALIFHIAPLFFNGSMIRICNHCSCDSDHLPTVSPMTAEPVCLLPLQHWTSVPRTGLFIFPLPCLFSTCLVTLIPRPLREKMKKYQINPVCTLPKKLL